MEVESHAIIKTANEPHLIISAPISYKSPLGIDVEVKKHDKDENTFVVVMKHVVTDLDSASYETEQELLRLANLLSWHQNVIVTNHKVTGYQYSEVQGHTNALILAGTAHVSASLSLTKTIGPESLRSFTEMMSMTYAEKTEEILLMWRDALREESPFGRLLLMFQILEKLSGSRTGADRLIRELRPDVELRMSGKKQDEEVSVYTYLRDCVHAKPENQRFPFSQFESRLSSFQQILRDALNDYFSDLPKV